MPLFHPGSRTRLSVLLLWGLVSCGPGNNATAIRTPEIEPPRLQNADDLDPRVVARVEEARGELLQRLDDPRAWAELGMVFENERMRNLAVRCYEQAARLDASEARWWFHMANALGKLGHHDRAIASIQRSIELNGQYAPSHTHLGNFELDLGQLDKARTAFERATEVDASYPGGWVGIARVQMQFDETQKAIAGLERLIAERPHDVLVQRLLSSAYRQAGRPDEAIVEEGEIPETVRWPDPWAEGLRARQQDPALRRVTKLLLEGEQLEALALLEEMRKRARTPEDEQAYLPQLGDLYLALGRLDDAESVQRRILEIQPENSQVFLALALIHDKRGDLRSAVEAIRTAVQMNPNHFPAYRQAGRLYYRAGLFAEAAEAFEKVLTYDENTTGVLYLLGMSRFSQRDWTAADKHFNELLLSSPDHADGWIAYARTNIKLHRLDEAEKALNTAKARGFGDRMMIRQVSASLQRARQRASRGALEQGR